MKRLALPLLALALLIGGGYAAAQTDYPTPQASVNSRGSVGQCLNAAGQAVANTAYPCGATPITASATGTTGVVTATLAAVAGKTTYLCGFTISATGTATAGNATVTGTVTGTLNYTQGVTATPLVTTQVQTFADWCVPASAVNTPIAINSIAAGTSGVTSVTAVGFQL
jgi:hypothetical protein